MTTTDLIKLLTKFIKILPFIILLASLIVCMIQEKNVVDARFDAEYEKMKMEWVENDVAREEERVEYYKSRFEEACDYLSKQPVWQDISSFYMHTRCDPKSFGI